MDNRESVSHAIQMAVKQCGGLTKICDRIWEGFSDTSVAGRRSSLALEQRQALAELGKLDAVHRNSDRAVSLRFSLEQVGSQLRDLNRENEASSRRRAHSCLMLCMSGDPSALRTLAALSLQVSNAFDAVVSACVEPVTKTSTTRSTP